MSPHSFSPVVQVFLDVGGEVQRLPIFFQIDLDAEVIGSLVPEEGPTPKWSEFFAATPNRSPITIGEDTYIGTNVFGQDYLPASQAFQLNVPLITQPQIKALIAQTAQAEHVER